MLGLRCCSGFSLVAGSGGCSWAAMLGLLIAVASLVALAADHGLQGVWVVLCEPPGSRAQAQSLWPTHLATSRRVGSSPTWDGTQVSCVGTQILHHWATRETPLFLRPWRLTQPQVAHQRVWVLFCPKCHEVAETCPPNSTPDWSGAPKRKQAIHPESQMRRLLEQERGWELQNFPTLTFRRKSPHPASLTPLRPDWFF